MMSVLSRLRGPRKLTPGEVAAAGNDLLVVDVREPAEYSGGHAPGAMNVPLGRLSDRLGEFARSDLPIAFICGAGMRSARATRAARGAGVDAHNIAGGMLAWSRAGLPIETGKAKRQKPKRNRAHGRG